MEALGVFHVHAEFCVMKMISSVIIFFSMFGFPVSIKSPSFPTLNAANLWKLDCFLFHPRTRRRSNLTVFRVCVYAPWTGSDSIY